MKKIFVENKSVESLIEKTMKNLQMMVDTNTIVGEPVFSPDGTIIIPISKVSVGFVVGGGEYTDVSIRRKMPNYPLAGGSGGGVSVSPIGFLIETNGEIKFIDIENKTAEQTALNLFNKVVNSLLKDGEKNENK